MSNVLSKMILRGWEGINVTANIDEELSNVKVAVKYSDHGDEFLFVKTKDGKTYLYGWFIGRRDYMLCPNYDDLNNSQDDYGFIRKPKLYRAYDNRSSLSNRIYFYVDREFDNGHHFDVPRIDTPECAQVKFNNYVRFMSDVYNMGITYHKEKDKKFIERYLKENGILTADNVEKLERVKFSSGENGVDGIAGKRKTYISKRLNGDKIDTVWYDGEFLDLKRVKFKSYLDREYFERFALNLDQFK